MISPWEQRYELLSAALQGYPGFQISRVDIDRSAPHYMYETLRIIGQNHPNDEVVLLIGGDSLRDLPKWKNPQEILASCSEIGVMRRPGYEVDLIELERVIPGLQQKIVWVEAPLLEISGSEIRARLRRRNPVRYYLPPTVYEIIESKQYYQSTEKY